MTIIKILKPFEKTLESRRFKIIMYLLTSIILAPIAAYLEYIGLRPVHIIWCIWLLIIPVTYFIYLVSCVVEKKEAINMPDILEPVGRLFFNNKDGKPIEPELALKASRKQLAEQKQKNEQLELVHRIVGGMAHSIRNSLVSIQTFLELHEERFSDPSFHEEFGSVAKRDLERLNRLLEQMIALVEPQHLMDINVFLNECVASLREETESIKIVTDLSERVPPVKCNKDVMKQALWYFMKYLTNTIGISGTLNIMSSVFTNSDEMNVIRITMTGKGSKVSKEELDKLFDPMAVAQSADIDLGPYASQKIIEEHGGHIEVESEKADGIRFVINIPSGQH